MHVITGTFVSGYIYQIHVGGGGHGWSETRLGEETKRGDKERRQREESGEGEGTTMKRFLTPRVGIAAT